GRLLRRLRTKPNVPLAFSPDGKTLASAEYNEGEELREKGVGMTLRLWEAATGKELWAAYPLPLGQLAYSTDGKALIWAGHHFGELRLYDTATGKELRRWGDEKQRPIWALAPAPNGRLLTVHIGLARLWDLNTGKEVWHLAGEECRNIT